MQHIDPKDPLTKWKTYSGMAAAFLAMNADADAQVIYTDVDPDVLISMAPYSIDFDGDGVFDVNFEHVSFTFTFSSQQVTVRNVIGTGDMIALANSSYVYPSALAAGAPIGPNDPNWNMVNAGTLAGLFSTGSYGSTTGEWVGQDAYIGCRFTSGDGEVHYAWVHLAVDPDLLNFTVKAYAYESIPELQIIAGNEGGPATVGDTEGPGRLQVFPNPVRDLTTVRFGDGMQGQVNVQVLDGIGRVLQQHNTSISAERSMTLDLSALPAGTYFIAVRNNKRVLHRTVTKVE